MVMYLGSLVLLLARTHRLSASESWLGRLFAHLSINNHMGLLKSFFFPYPGPPWRPCLPIGLGRLFVAAFIREIREASGALAFLLMANCASDVGLGKYAGALTKMIPLPNRRNLSEWFERHALRSPQQLAMHRTPYLRWVKKQHLYP